MRINPHVIEMAKSLVTLLSSVYKVDISQMVINPVSSSDTFKTASVFYGQLTVTILCRAMRDQTRVRTEKDNVALVESTAAPKSFRQSTKTAKDTLKETPSASQ